MAEPTAAPNARHPGQCRFSGASSSHQVTASLLADSKCAHLSPPGTSAVTLAVLAGGGKEVNTDYGSKDCDCSEEQTDYM